MRRGVETNTTAPVLPRRNVGGTTTTKQTSREPVDKLQPFSAHIEYVALPTGIQNAFT